MAEKTTFIKGDQKISVTPEEAITFQGGTKENPFAGLINSKWVQQTVNAQDLTNVKEPVIPKDMTTPEQAVGLELKLWELLVEAQ